MRNDACGGDAYQLHVTTPESGFDVQQRCPRRERGGRANPRGCKSCRNRHASASRPPGAVLECFGTLSDLRTPCEERKTTKKREQGRRQRNTKDGGAEDETDSKKSTLNHRVGHAGGLADSLK